MKHKRITLLSIVLMFAVLAYAQTEETGKVIYVDSANIYRQAPKMKRLNIRTISNRSSKDSIDIISREKKIKATVIDPYGYRSDDILRCIKMAIDNWESRLSLSNIIKFYVSFNDEMDSDVEIRTTVLYSSGENMTAIPTSLYYQSDCLEKESGIIEINPYISWDSSWANEIGTYGYDNMVTALQRHIAHILGFGISVGCINGTYSFAIRRGATIFDNLVTNGQKTLGSMVRKSTNADFEDFFKSNLYLYIGNKSFPIYSSPAGYVPYRTGCYFALPNEDMLNYPYNDRTKLFSISDETLEVIEAIGWTVKPHDISISGTGLDASGYGSLYLPPTFHAMDNNGNIINKVSWTYQLYNNVTGNYETQTTGQGQSFTIVPSDQGMEYVDDFSSQQVRILCNTIKEGKAMQYSYPVYLETCPYLVDYEIYNVKNDPTNSQYCTFDARLNYVGASGGWVTVTDGSTSKTFNLSNTNEMEIKNVRIYKYDSAYLDITLTNNYGTTDKSIYLNTYIDLNSRCPQPTRISQNDTGKGEIEIYSLYGTKTSNKNNINTIRQGVYIIVENKEGNRICKKYIVR